jgi:hypothetical protein
MVHLSTSALNHIVGQETIPPATIGLAAEKTPPPLPQGGGTIWLGEGGVWGSLLIYIYGRYLQSNVSFCMASDPS